MLIGPFTGLALRGGRLLAKRLRPGRRRRASLSDGRPGDMARRESSPGARPRATAGGERIEPSREIEQLRRTEKVGGEMSELTRTRGGGSACRIAIACGPD